MGDILFVFDLFICYLRYIRYYYLLILYRKGNIFDILIYFFFIDI